MPTSSTFAPASRAATTIASRFSRVAASLPPRSASLPPSSMTTMAGWCCFEQRRQPRASARGGVAGDRRVDHALFVAIGLQLGGEAGRPRPGRRTARSRRRSSRRRRAAPVRRVWAAGAVATIDSNAQAGKQAGNEGGRVASNGGWPKGAIVRAGLASPVASVTLTLQWLARRCAGVERRACPVCQACISRVHPHVLAMRLLPASSPVQPTDPCPNPSSAPTR